MTMKRTTLLLLSLSCASAAGAADLLVSLEGRAIERRRETADGLVRVGTFADGRALPGFRPTGLAVAPSGLVYAGDAGGGGRIVMFGPDGACRGTLATLGRRPDALCLSPDGAWLYVSQPTESAVYRYRTADGTGGAYPLDGVRGPRGLAFGPDGLLYVGCRQSREVRAYDVSGEKAAFRGRLSAPRSFGTLAFAGAAGERLVVPGSKLEVVDLFEGRVEPARPPLQNAFAVCVAGETVYVGDWTTGALLRLDAGAEKPEAAGSGAESVCAMAVLGDGGADARRREFARRKARIVLREPVRPQADDDFARLKFNNPGAVTGLKAGFAGAVHVTDYDGDGQLDLLVYSGWEGQVWEGCWLFRNPTPKGKKDADPVFEAPRRVPRSAMPSVGVCRDAAGRPIANVLSTNQSYEARQLIDWDGDGRDDLLISASVRPMGIHDASGYDARGVWTAPQMRGCLFWCRGLGGSGAAARYGDPQIVRLEDGAPMSVPGWNPALVRDWDGDGDLDVILCDFNDAFHYFENVGTRERPVFTAGRFLRLSDGSRMAGYQCMPSVEAVDWDGDGLADVVRCDEEGRVYWYRNTGKTANGMPVFEAPRFFRQRADELCASALSTPWAVDWDGDGDLDLLSGDTAGTIDFYENLSGPGVERPKWAPPVKLTTPDGKPVRIIAGPSGSLQGPIEAMYGYTCLSAADWDGDGLPDLMVNSVWGKVVWYRNVGTRQRPKLDFARPVEVEWDGPQPTIPWFWLKPGKTADAKALVTHWRTTPVMVDLNGDGLTDLAMMDVDGDLAFFERTRRADGSLALKSPRKAFRTEDGRPFQLAYNWLGGPANRWEGRVGLAGRRKFCLCDWDGDGKLDIVLNGGANAEWWRQVRTEDAADGRRWVFAYGGRVGDLDISTHDPQPCAVDFDGNGVPDVVVGAMDGYFYYLRNPRSAEK